MTVYSNKRLPRDTKYRSGFERVTANALHSLGVEYGYEAIKIQYLIPAMLHTYTPDWILWSNGIIIETKGLFNASDRKKHLMIRKQHPELDIRFVFCNSRVPICKGSKTTYARWCERNGFIYSDRTIPMEWYKEKPRPYLQVLKRVGSVQYEHKKQCSPELPKKG